VSIRNNDRDGRQSESQNGGRYHLGFAESEFLQQNRLWDTVFSPFAKFHANISHIIRDIAFKPIFKMAAAAILGFSQK